MQTQVQSSTNVRAAERRRERWLTAVLWLGLLGVLMLLSR